MTLNAMMKHERSLYLEDSQGKKANGNRPGRVYGHGKILELRIHRDRNGEFYSRVIALLRSQQAETDWLVSALYRQGLSQSQVGKVFERLYGRKYSSSQFVRMIEWMHEDVARLNNRTLETYYPIVLIDALWFNMRRDSVRKEAFYVVLGVKEDRRTREVIALTHQPSESAIGWVMLLVELIGCGVNEIDLLVVNGLSGLEEGVAWVYPGADFQRCVTYMKRRLIARVRSEDKPQLAEDLRGFFATDLCGDSPEQGWQHWKACCGKWQVKYRRLAQLKTDSFYRSCFSYLNYDRKIRSIIYTINWIERPNKDFCRVIKVRYSLQNEDSVISLLGTVAMDKEAYRRKIPKLNYEQRLFKEHSHGNAP